ncbi:Na+/H+ antiporter NhaA [Thalassobaculum salexigens]|uniref:Na+/H+ antiporter NhaA n=1 Tax=Thalassobaculum salexigens TaxID=455360 RepID=UPI00248EC2DE|nr:DUF1015 family protein [Thalassobaculum salexigens]
MVDIRPFKGVRHAGIPPEKMGDVTSPPYDVFTPEMQRAYHARHPHNVVRLIQGEFKEGGSPLEVLEHVLHPWVAFMILPLFAFANAGVPLAGMAFSDLLAPVPLGIAAGLVVGKPIGILGACWIAVRLGWANLPDGVNWLKLYGVSQLAGIGFTMSLFIGTLAFSDPGLQSAVRIGVLGGTIVSIVLGLSALAWALRERPAAADTRPATPAESASE